jgi:methionyl-tRNA formyltransferase
MSGDRSVYLGTSEFAVAVLRRLAASPHRPALVVTPPDRPKGRGRRLAAPPAAIAARELGLDVYQTDGVSGEESVERLRASGAEIGVVCAFGQLIREPLLSELELLNVHPSLIPRWRGAAPIERAIMAGDAETGVTIMRVDAGLDSGPVALAERTPIEPTDDYGTLSARLAELGGELTVRALDLRAPGELQFRDQDESRATYAAKIDPSERRLDPGRPAVELERTVRALTPHIGAYLKLDGGERLGVRVAAAEDGALTPGRLAADGEGLRLGCGEGVLRIFVVQPSGKRPMPADDYLRGHPPPLILAPSRGAKPRLRGD